MLNDWLHVIISESHFIQRVQLGLLIEGKLWCFFIWHTVIASFCLLRQQSTLWPLTGRFQPRTTRIFYILPWLHSLLIANIHEFIRRRIVFIDFYHLQHSFPIGFLRVIVTNSHILHILQYLFILSLVFLAVYYHPRFYLIFSGVQVPPPSFAHDRAISPNQKATFLH